MSESEHMHGDDEEKHLVRERLKGLEKHKAPWYFDAQLQQRLRKPQRGGFFSIPLPSYALSAIAVAGIGVISYYTVFNTTPPDVQQAVPMKVEERVQKEVPPKPTQENEHKGSDQSLPASKGPSVPAGDATIESHIESAPDDGKATMIQKSIPQHVQGDQPVFETSISAETAKEDSLAHARADSLKRLEREQR